MALRTGALHSAVRRAPWRRLLHNTPARYAITNLEMPAMSPTMMEGGITGWKKKEGENFSAGDVLVEIETDKATIDVEAQDDGIVGKILLPDGSKNVAVGKIIALLAEEGDDISDLQPPKEEKPPQKREATVHSQPSGSSVPKSAEPSSPAATKTHSGPPSNSRPIFPSVHRLLQEFSISKLENIRGTGVRGMITKGDVLAYLGKASSPTGTYKEPPSVPTQVVQDPKKEEREAFDGAAIRRLIVSTMLQTSMSTRSIQPVPADFDSIIADYLPRIELKSEHLITPSSTPTKPTSDYLDGLY